MPRYALVRPNNSIDRFSDTVVPTVQTKPGWRWLFCPPVAPPSYDPETQKVTGPSYAVNANDVTESWGTATLSAGELASMKTDRFNSINGNGLKKALHSIYNKALQGNGEATVTYGQFLVWMKDQI